MESTGDKGATHGSASRNERNVAASASEPTSHNLPPRVAPIRSARVNANAPLINARKLETAEVRARDGVVGCVDDLLFDRATWTVRYLVVDTGGWLAGRRVLIATFAISGHATDTNCFSTDLTQEQVRTSPPATSAQEPTRDHEARLHEHYRWPPYWISTPAASGIVPPPAAFERPEPRSMPEPAPDEPHLRRARHVRGYRVAATDGAIGVLDDFLLEPRSWRVAFLIVDTNGWLPGGKVLLEPHTIDRVSGSEAKLFVHEERAVAKTHPPYIPDEALHTDYLAGRHSPQPPIVW